jgi:lysophospholipase L1-like esterase
VLCTLNYFQREKSNWPGYPSRNGSNTIYQYNDAIRAAADYFGCDVIEFDKDGITYANASSGQYYEEDKNGTNPSANHTHPTAKGHAVMANRALIDLKKINSMT